MASAGAGTDPTSAELSNSRAILPDTTEFEPATIACNFASVVKRWLSNASDIAMDFTRNDSIQRQIISRQGKKFVVVPLEEFRQLERLAAGAELSEVELPPVPSSDANGNYPALDYIRASIARDIIRERRDLGLSQQALAKLAGVRQETLSRLESGKHSPTVRTVEKIDRALKSCTRVDG